MFKHFITSRRSVMRIVAAMLAVVFASWSDIGTAQEKWDQLSSPQNGFEALFPKAPTETPVSANQRNFLADLGSTAYIVSVLDNVPPKQNWEGLVEAYANGSASKVRNQHTTTLAGYPGVEAITDNEAADLSSLLNVVLVGNRLYQVVSVGPKGHETSAEAYRFRDSFRVLEEKWTEFSSPKYGFAALFPKTPAESPVGPNQRNFLNDLGNTAYFVSVLEKAAPNQNWQKLVEAYAKGSGGKVKTQRPATLAGRPGVEAITEDEANNISSLVYMIVVGNRLYQVVSAGPKGHETSADAYRFRDSFRLLR
jgi:hypothetical protein